MDRFVAALMKKEFEFKHIENQNIRKIYNQWFEILIYNIGGKKSRAIVIDKRPEGHPIVYNNIEIASHYILG